MAVGTSALVLALPGESAEAIGEKVRQAGTPSVQLLVPEGVVALHNLGGVEHLRGVAAANSIDLVLISSDQATLSAAQMGGIVALGVEGAQVHIPAPPPAQPEPPDSYATRRLPESGPKLPPPVPASLDDDDFLRELEQLYAAPSPTAPPAPVAPVAPVVPIVPVAIADSSSVEAAPERPLAAAPSTPPPAPIAPEDADIFAALDDLSESYNQAGSAATPAAASAGYDDFAAELDDWSTTAVSPQAPAREVPPPRPRVRPEDIELSAEEVRRAGASSRRGAPAPRAVRPAPAPVRATRPLPIDVDDDDDDDDDGLAPRRNWLPLVALGLIALLAGIAAVLYFGNRAVVSVVLPVPDSAVTSFEQLAVPLVPLGQASDTAVAAEQIAGDVTFAASGTVNETTQAPATGAAGLILIQSLNTQPLSFPPGVEFVAIKADGQEVRFVSEAQIDVPPASTSDQGAQIITTRGQVQVNIVARAPGSASNVEANTIRLMIVPGQQPFEVTGGNLVVRHDPIGGGSEQEIRIVTEAAVQQVLQEALTGLDNRARQVLESQIAGNADLAIEIGTIAPTTADLSALRGFEYTVTPAVGEPVDTANPVFDVAVQARYSALATPRNAPVNDQLRTVVSNLLISAGLMNSDGCQAPIDVLPRWDGTRLTVDGKVGPNPRCADQGLDGVAQQRIKDAVRGKERAEAERALQALVDEGLIASYRLPTDASRLPGLDNQITVQVGP